MCPNTGVGRLCTGRHQESLLFALRLQNSLVGRGASREILTSDGMYYKEYTGTMMVLTPVTLPEESLLSFALLFLVLTSIFLFQLLLLSLKLWCVYITFGL